MAKLKDTIIYGSLRVLGKLKVNEVEGDLKVIGGSIKGELNKIGVGTTAGTNTAYTYTNSNFLLEDGSILVLKLHIANEKAATLNVNGIGAKSIIDIAGKPIIKGFSLNSYITLVYNGTNFIIQGGGSSGTGGITLNPSDLGIAQGSSLVKVVGGSQYAYATTPNTEAPNIITATFDDLLYGLYSIMLRISFTGISSTSDLIKIETYHVVNTTETLLNTAKIKPSDLTTAGTFEVFGFVTDFKGSSGLSSPKLRVKISILANSISNNFFFDYIRVAPTYTSIFSLPTT